MTVLQNFIEQIRTRIHGDSFIKLSLGNYKGAEKELKNIYIKPVSIKREVKLSFTYRYKTRDIVKNYGIDEGIALLISLINVNAFRSSTLFGTEENLVCECQRNGDWKIYRQKPTAQKTGLLSHDNQKERKIEKNKSYLQELRLTDSDGQVFKSAQDKWKQINHYIELLQTSLDDLPSDRQLTVVDMGAGKGYLTFALYDYLSGQLKKDVLVQGVEFRDDLVELCNGIAQRASMKGLSFHQGSIGDFEPTVDLDILIALHACDTATDDAIFKGIRHNAQLIVVAPCCHKQIRRELESNKVRNDLQFMTQYGVFLERHAEMLTDSIRALILEYYGYQTKVVQFVSDMHTPKNVMIIAVKKKVSLEKQHEVLKELDRIKKYFGITYHHLEKLCKLPLP